jgi:regulator of protease activity HflC (stomatin/prohibitin superfamily)
MQKIAENARKQQELQAARRAGRIAELTNVQYTQKKENRMFDALTQLNQEHADRQLQRMKTRAPITLISALIVIASVLTCLWLVSHGNPPYGIATVVCGVIISALWSMAAHLLAEWDRAVILRMGHFRCMRGPGFFVIIPFIDSVVRVVDMRVRTTTFYSEAMLTRDTVPVNIDAIAFWHVWDSQKALLEVESYYQAISLAVQTALRDMVGIHSLADILAEREKIGRTLQQVLEAKTEAWGISVSSIEIRDISIPENLKDALSKQAQAERERQARNILGQAEMEIAAKFAEAAKGYTENPVALQLRAMNIVYEGIRAGGSLMLIPSSVLDTMNLGGIAALGQVQQQKATKLAAPQAPANPGL